MTRQPLIPGKKRIKRKKNGTNKPYFGKEVHDAVVEYVLSVDETHRHLLFTSKIRPAFDKLVENVIHIYGFMKSSDNFDELKADAVAHLYEKLPKFNPHKECKAFSYFNIVARNHLTLTSRKKTKEVGVMADIENREAMSPSELESLDRYCTVDSPDEKTIQEQYIHDIIELMGVIEERVRKDNEKKTIQALIYTFKNLDNVELLNKRAVFEYLRNITGLNSKQLTTTIASIKKHYKSLRGDKTYGIFI
jgi:hypothetical protein